MTLGGGGQGLLFDRLRAATTVVENGQYAGLMDTKVAEFLTRRELSRMSSICKRWWIDLHTLQSFRLRFPFYTAFPAALRSEYWHLILHGEAPRQFATGEDMSLVESRILSGDYDRFMLAEIDKDVSRTYAAHRFFTKQEESTFPQQKSAFPQQKSTFPQQKSTLPQQKSTFPSTNSSKSHLTRGQRSLRRVLFCVLSRAPRPTEYCQGMNYIAALFLTVFGGDEVAASECLFHFFFTVDFVRNFENGFGDVLKVCEELNQFSKANCPTLTRALQLNEISLDLFSFSWCLLLFAYDLQSRPETLSLIAPLWDQFLMRGREALVSVCNCLLVHLEDELDPRIDIGYEETIMLVKGQCDLGPYFEFLRHSGYPSKFLAEFSYYSDGILIESYPYYKGQVYRDSQTNYQHNITKVPKEGTPQRIRSSTSSSFFYNLCGSTPSPYQILKTAGYILGPRSV